MIKMHCEGCLAELEFSSPQSVPALAARDELAALNFWTQNHATCTQSMLALRESAAIANVPPAPVTPAVTTGAPAIAQPQPTVSHEMPPPPGLPIAQ